MTRRDVWVDHMDDGRYQVRWHGGEWRDRDGSYGTTDKKVAWRIVQDLIRQDGGEGGTGRRAQCREPAAGAEQRALRVAGRYACG